MLHASVLQNINAQQNM